MHSPRLWDIFCRVIDNHGDLGVCWRLSRDLAARGERVRLWVDDASALRWMAPAPRPLGIEVLPWPEQDTGAEPGEVVVEAFGCELPAPFVARMQAQRPHWINLEYLSAESFVERSHGLASPQLSGPGLGLSKRFYYPGFTERTGGLLREPGLLGQIAEHDGQAWLAARGWSPKPSERVVSLFAYANSALPALFDLLAQAPTLLLVCPSPAQISLASGAGLRSIALPFLTQDDYDRLLWSCDLNFVRGEDSFVRAQWAGKPWVWQIYPQDDGAHAAKLQAFMDRAALPPEQRALHLGWNGLADLPAQLTDLSHAHQHALAWRAHLAAGHDLVGRLFGFLGLHS